MGALDEGLQAAANALVDAFVDGKITVRRRAKRYDPLSGEETVTQADYQMKASPPAMHRLTEIEGDMPQRVEARRIVVPTIQMQQATATPATAAPFGDFEKSDIVFLLNDATAWRILSIDELQTGDDKAGVEITLRK